MQTFCAHPRGWVLQALQAPFAYTGHIKRLIARLKFGRQRWLGQVLGELLRPALVVGDYDLCVPVPLHTRRLAQRGFNQAQEIAVGMAPARAGMKLTRALQRVRDTPPQTQLGATERHNNLAGCFQVISTVESLSILLVDDVVTTGSTMNTLAALLRDHGACFVAGVAVARTVAPYTAKV